MTQQVDHAPSLTARRSVASVIGRGTARARGSLLVRGLTLASWSRSLGALQSSTSAVSSRSLALSASALVRAHATIVSSARRPCPSGVFELARKCGRLRRRGPCVSSSTIAPISRWHLGRQRTPRAERSPAERRTWSSPAHDRCFLPQRGRCRARRGFGAVDYVGLGPIFPTRSKTNPDPVVGLSQLAETCARHSDLAVVAIGGIELTSLASIRNAQARGAAMIGALFREGVDPGDAFSEATPRWRAAS